MTGMVLVLPLIVIGALALKRFLEVYNQLKG